MTVVTAPGAPPRPHFLTADYRRMVVATLVVALGPKKPEFEVPFYLAADLSLNDVAAFIECQDEAVQILAVQADRLARRTRSAQLIAEGHARLGGSV